MTNRSPCRPSSEGDFPFLLVSPRAVYGPPASWGIYTQQLAVLAQWLADGQLQPPQIRDLGGLSVATVRTAHQLLEDGHVQGKLVMTLR